MLDFLVFLAGILLVFGLGVITTLLLQRVMATMVESRINSIKGAKGRAQRADNEERLMLAVAEVAQAVQGGATPTDALKQVAMKYPDVAMKIGSKMLSGKLGNLGGDEE